jgi:phenylacetate-CoA ligase
MSQNKLSVVVPCFNEEPNVEALVTRIHQTLSKMGLVFEVVLVDDGSSDNTWAEIGRMTAEFPTVVTGIQNEGNQGILSSWMSGITAARSGVVCLMDADLQNPPEALEAMWEAFNSTQCHMMQGSRSSIEWDAGARYTASRGLNWLLNIAFKDDAVDNKSGFVMAPREILLECLSFRKKYRYGHTFIRISARAKGYQVSEIETLFLPRHAGESFLSSSPALKVYLAVLADIFRALGEFGRGKSHPIELAIADEAPGLAPYVGYRGSRKLRLDVYFATMRLHAWFIRPKTKYLYQYLTRTQWLSSEELRRLQIGRLQRLLWHSYVHVPFYRKTFARVGLTPRDIKSIEDLAKLPFLSKSDVGENLYFDMFSDTHNKKDMHKIATSGSTGQPFVTYADRLQLEMRFASTLRSAEWTGWQVGDKQVRLWHQTLGMNRVQVFKEKFDAILLRRTFIPAFELTAEGLQGLATQLNKIKPRLIDGYAESLNFLSTFLNRGGKLEFSPRGVMSSAQMLTKQTRAEIEGGLGSRVYDKYGAREFSGIAYQCDFGEDHHVVDESYIVELFGPLDSLSNWRFSCGCR